MARKIERVSKAVKLQDRGESNPLDVEVVVGPNFERLVNAIGERIEEVMLNEDGMIQVTLNGDIAWEHGVVSGPGKVEKDGAALKLVARAATYIAAKKRLAREDDLGFVVESRELDVESTWYTNRGPWFNSFNNPFTNSPKAQLGLRPIRIKDALCANTEVLIEEVRHSKPFIRRFAGIGLGSVISLATACSYAPPPAEVQIIETPAWDASVVPTPTKEPTPEPTATEFADMTPEAEFEEVGFIPGAFPGAGGENWRYIDVLTVSGGGEVDTSIIKEEGFTPLAEAGVVVAILAEGENGSSFFLVPRLDQAQYRRPDNSIGVARFNPDLSGGLVHVYSDGDGVIYRQPGVMADFGDGTIPILGREDVTGDVWVLYVDGNGQINRKAPAFFGPDSQVEMIDGRVLVDGNPMKISEVEETWVSGEWYREDEQGVVQEFVGGEWQEVGAPEDVESPVVLGEDGVPVIVTEGIEIAEYIEGEWRLKPFGTPINPDLLLEHKTYPPRFFQVTNSSTSPWLKGNLALYYSNAFLEGVRVNVDPVSGETSMELLLFFRGKVFKARPTVFRLLDATVNTNTLGFYNLRSLSIFQAEKVVQEALKVMVPGNPHQPGRPRFILHIISPPKGNSEGCVNFPNPVFQEACRAFPDENKVSSRTEMESLVSEHMRPVGNFVSETGEVLIEVPWWEYDIQEIPLLTLSGLIYD